MPNHCYFCFLRTEEPLFAPNALADASFGSNRGYTVRKNRSCGQNKQIEAIRSVSQPRSAVARKLRTEEPLFAPNALADASFGSNRGYTVRKNRSCGQNKQIEAIRSVSQPRSAVARKLRTEEPLFCQITAVFASYGLRSLYLLQMLLLMRHLGAIEAIQSPRTAAAAKISK
ncbi:hypothetical protein B9T62_06135 [Paenibacillus donghaensis]|uniref:Uncharacterized protein n=1 Tax=Paenibacillus donghaensis TaxID=414771 RepID=A0A2Z2KNQ8_9BACL|nr:hypothetical protein B9T62_06135 [Paenibacillus donghaensis]